MFVNTLSILNTLMYIQISLTKYGFWCASELSHLTVFWFPFSFHLWRGDTPSLSNPRSVLRASNNNDLLFYNFVVKNVFCQSILIYNIALHNTDLGVLQKSSQRSLIYIFFPSGEGAPPPPSLSHPLATSCFALVYYNSRPPPPPPSTKSWSAELLYGFLTEDQNNYTKICWWNQSLKLLRIH